MRLYSTNNKQHFVSLREAILKGLPEDNGLFMPETVPVLEDDFIKNLGGFSFQEIAFRIARTLFMGEIPDDDLREIIYQSITFPAPLVRLDERKYILELFHGPSLAFKDFGARFMARLMSYFNRDESEELVILVATSGDTGGAVAAGFYDAPGIRVVILYPSGKVSSLQEKQLTTLGKNITALEVDGSFDDCQALVKKAFLDRELNQRIRLSSANSINIARLIPQSFYYFEAFKQLPGDEALVVFCVPSGNFGNLTAGLFARKMGLPVHHFIAATNINDVVPEYLHTGIYSPRPSSPTISNAMDVGNPSNFARMTDLFFGDTQECSTWNNMKKEVSGHAFTDDETRKAIAEVCQKYHYTIDPHGAVGYLAALEYQKAHSETRIVVLETAHPSKFKDEIERILEKKVDIPKRLADLANKEKEAVWMENDFGKFKEWLMGGY
jgi:threonine synthase